MKQSRHRLAILIAITLYCFSNSAHGSQNKHLQNDLRFAQAADSNQSTRAKEEEANASPNEHGNGFELSKRNLPIRMGLAANPDVLTQEPGKKRRRSFLGNLKDDVTAAVSKLHQRSLPPRLGLAINPEVLTQDQANLSSKRTRRSLGDGTSFDKTSKLEPRFLHLGLAANPNVLTQELPSSTLRKRTPISEVAQNKLKEGQEDEDQKNLPIVLSSSVLTQTNAQKPLINLNTVGKGKSITFPVYRRERAEFDQDLHPEMHFQQHLNHALKRHAKFLEKSIDESILVDNLRGRAESLGLTIEENSLRRRGFPALVARQQQSTETSGYPLSAFLAAKNATITAPIATTAANSVGLHIEANDVGYFAEILVGTPPAPFKVILDTGSSDSWLMLEDCRSLKNPSRSCNHPTLNSASSTFKRTSNSFKVTYGTGKVVGVIVQETMNLGGLILNNHAFGGVTGASDEFTGKNVPFDGLMGTAKSVLSNQKVLTPIEALAKQGTLSGAFIGYALGRVSDSENIGEVTFGGVDQTKFSGDLTIFPNINKKGFWEGAMSTVQVDGKPVLVNRTGILDTGTTLMVVPAEDAAAVHANIPGAKSDGKGGYRIPCTNKVKVGLNFGGVMFEINPVDLTFQPVGKNLSGQCLSGISTGTVGGPTQWLIGDVFLKNVYFATDVTNDQMGLALLNRVSPKDQDPQQVS